ncbi:MAG: hypothetical protein KGZ89_01695 [Actinobacteria bacterium]|nr:hypothetical protein [Actinomycetota bacterium]
MPQYGVLVFSPAPADPMSLTPEYLELIDGYPALAKKLGGKVLGGSYFSGDRGFAFEPSTTAKAIRGEVVSDGPYIESELVAAAFFVLSAPDLDTAVRIAKLHPAARDGGAEVRPLFTSPTPESPR